jgi:hypothetical protein
MNCPLPLRLISLACLTTLMAASAQAENVLGTLQPGYPYIGLAVGQSRAALAEQRIADTAAPLGTTATLTSRDENATSYRGFIGYQFNTNIGTELDYYNLGMFV